MPGLDPIFDAFWDLGSDRTFGAGIIGPIPWRSIDAYAARYGYEGDEFDRFSTLIKSLDAAFLRDARARANAKD